MYYSIIALTIGVVADFIFGDPQFGWHLIRLMGRSIDIMEKYLRKWFPKSKTGEVLAGILLVMGILVLWGGGIFCIVRLCYNIHPMIGLMVESGLCYQCMATKSLKTESKKVFDRLNENDLPGARKELSMIVGRDTHCLDEEQVSKATIETIAENTSDGCIGPLFYMFLGGCVGGAIYKAVNTMDSMVGYRNETYEFFGKTAAITDDVVNYIPARVSAVCMIIASFLLRLNGKEAVRIYGRDRRKHDSPNSAHTEAVAAGALNLTLAGDCFYFGKLKKKETIGDGNKVATKKDILKMHGLLYGTVAVGFMLMLVMTLILKFII